MYLINPPERRSTNIGGESMNYEEYVAFLYETIEKLKAGEQDCLKIVYQAMAFSDMELVKKAGTAIKTALKGKTSKQMITLSEQFRQYTSLEWSINWTTLDIKEKRFWFASEEDYKFVLIAGSFHPNGYYRERCAKELYNYADTLGYMLIRTNDWVSPIRETMFPLTLGKIDVCSIDEILLAIPFMEKLSRCGRIEREFIKEVETAFYQKIESNLIKFPLKDIPHYEFYIRKIIYRMLVENQILTLEQINDLLDIEKHTFCKQIIITKTLTHYHCTREQLDKFLKSKNGIVRRRTLEYKYGIEKDYWEGLEVMLLDDNKGVRELVSFILQHHSDISIIDYYVSHLQDENPVNAIVGLGEHGGKKDGELLLPFLKSPVPKVVCVTLKSLAKTLEYDGYDIYAQYLVHKEISISKSAYLAIRHCNIHYGTETLYSYCLEYDYLHVKRYVLLLMLRENSWNRLPFLLELYKQPGFEDELEELILSGIATRNMYGRISKKQEEAILEKLEKKAYLLPKAAKEIRFDIKFVVEK